VTFAQCQFGSDYRKYTTLACSPGTRAQLHAAFAWARCFCRKHKKVAKGLDEFGGSLSAPSGEYPPAMNAELAYALVASVRVKLNVSPSEEAPAGLHVGSADPHMLRLDDDKAPRSRKAPTFSMTAHEPASRDELLARPLPVLNAPATTDAAEPPPCNRRARQWCVALMTCFTLSGRAVSAHGYGGAVGVSACRRAGDSTWLVSCAT